MSLLQTRKDASEAQSEARLLVRVWSLISNVDAFLIGWAETERSPGRLTCVLFPITRSRCHGEIHSEHIR
jgi:hypothetical protein